jgi:hypothetical protein
MCAQPASARSATTPHRVSAPAVPAVNDPRTSTTAMPFIRRGVISISIRAEALFRFNAPLPRIERVG